MVRTNLITVVKRAEKQRKGKAVPEKLSTGNVGIKVSAKTNVKIHRPSYILL